MKKTPIQKLIEFMEQNQYFIGNDLYAKQKELLEEEKQMVIDSWIDGEGRFFDAGTEIIEAEKYFNETYQNKEEPFINYDNDYDMDGND